MIVASDGTRALLEVADQPGVGAVALRRVVDQNLSDRPLGSTPNPSKTNLIVPPIIPKAEAGESLKKIRSGQVLERCERLAIKILSPLDPEYPVILRTITDYPPFLYVKGNAKCLSLTACAVVGTRKASRLGVSWARQIAEVLSSRGITIVSGLALGIDTAAHEGALRASGITIAVMAHGLDQVTPSSNKALAEQILLSGGSLVSEHPPGVPPRKAEYVRRNRLQSGMSVCSIVVESGEQGGAIHQARFTKEQGRELLTVLPPDTVPESEGFNRRGGELLVREMGAKPLSGRNDLLEYISSNFFQEKHQSILKQLNYGRRLL